MGMAMDDATDAPLLFKCRDTGTGLYNWSSLYPVYVRGEAYLGAHQGSEAAAEFQKILTIAASW